MMQAHNILKSITIDEVLDAVREELQRGQYGLSEYGFSESYFRWDRVRARLAEPAKAEEQSEKTCGWYKKFTITRTDGKAIGRGDDGCEYFVLDLDHDKHAPAALRAYAESCKNDNPELYYDILNKVGDVPYRDPEHLGVKPKAEQPHKHEYLNGRCACGDIWHSPFPPPAKPEQTQPGESVTSTAPDLYGKWKTNLEQLERTLQPGESTMPSYVAYMAMTPAEREAVVQKAQVPIPQHDAILAKMVSDLVLMVSDLVLRVDALEKGAK